MHDHGQRVVQLVCNPSEESSQCGEFFVLMELLPLCSGCRSKLRLAKLSLNRRDQQAETTLGKEIMSTGPHGGDRDIVTGAARNQNEGDVFAGGLQYFKGLQTGKARHHIVGENDVPIIVAKGGLHLRRGLYASRS